MAKTKKAKNLLAKDPTRTTTLRNRAVGELNQRFGELKKLITTSIVKNKVFVENANPLQKSDFVFLRTPQKLERFDIWLEQAISEIILSGGTDISSPQLNWLLGYFKESYERGAKKGNNELASVYGRNEIQARLDILSAPFHIEKLQLIFTRDFAQLKGITEAMSQQINYHLSEALLKGENPRQVAKTINDRVDAIGITRARLLARTEIINTHNLAKVNEGKILSDLLGEDVVYRWITSGDIKVRPEHVSRNNKYYSFERVAELIGEPNCRCAVVAVPLSVVPDDAEVVR
jgi:SPP1 gp7 family putative phage head morphogenesis protein